MLPSNVGDYVVNAYVHMRKRTADTNEFMYTCARTLLSIVRLASALVL
jgi:DNA replication licensing factor MCM7